LGHYQMASSLGTFPRGHNPPSYKRVNFLGIVLGQPQTIAKQRVRRGKRVKKTTSSLQPPCRKSVESHYAVAESRLFRNRRMNMAAANVETHCTPLGQTPTVAIHGQNTTATPGTTPKHHCTPLDHTQQSRNHICHTIAEYFISGLLPPSLKNGQKIETNR